MQKSLRHGNYTPAGDPVVSYFAFALACDNRFVGALIRGGYSP